MDKAVLSKIHNTELEILKKVDQVCRDHQLTYYLVGGTLLGAARHDGFIPWDDDLDIALPRADYNRLIRLCADGVLGEKYYLHHISTDPNYWFPFAKIKKNNTLFEEEFTQKLNCHKGIFIDVFPLDSCRKNEGLFYHLRARIIKKLAYLISSRVAGDEPDHLLRKVLFRFTYCLSTKKLSQIRDAICSLQKNGDYIINYASNYAYTKQTMPREYYEPASKLRFEDAEFSVPGKYILYLEQLFGDWKQLPPPEKQRTHNPKRLSFDTNGPDEKLEGETGI